MKKKELKIIAGTQLRRLREGMGITQKELAAELTKYGFSVKQVSISRYEKATVSVPAAIIIATKLIRGY